VQKDEVTIVCFGAFGDIINCTPIAKHYKKEGKLVRWITKDKYANVLSNNDYIDEILLLKNSKLNNASLTRKFKSSHFVKQNEIILFTAPYMSKFYDGSTRSTLLDIIKDETSEIKEWNCDFIPVIDLSQNEIDEANSFLEKVDKQKRILIEFESFSGQTFLSENNLFKLFSEFEGNFILTGISKPTWFDSLKDLNTNSNFYFYNGSFKSNAEIYNNCDFFIGCCSGITCLTSSDYCVKSKSKRIECCRGPHWSSLAWEHNSANKQICYNRKQFEAAIKKWM
tara:strand:+ start:1120 stop:1965 length:846 start_codon:yes stop_codon:yes gene_type:complete